MKNSLIMDLELWYTYFQVTVFTTTIKKQIKLRKTNSHTYQKYL